MIRIRIIVRIEMIIVIVIIRRPLGAHGCADPVIKLQTLKIFKVQEYIPLRSQLPRPQMTTVPS